MKNRNIRLLKSISLSFCILIGITFPLLFSFFDSSNLSLDNRQDSGDMFVSSVNGKNYLAKYITAEDIEDMKKKSSIQSPIETWSKPNSINLIDGHGMGYATPSSEDLESLIGKVSLLDVVPESGQKYQATADLSSEIFFPAVGDQGNQGSCSAWANAYYAYGYLEAKDYGWDASSGIPDYLLSPAWAYNIVASSDHGSIPYEVAQVLLDWGIPTLSAMPYDDNDVNSWGNETAWQQAPYHRPLDYTLIEYTGIATIDLIKSLIDSGTPVTIGIDAYQFYNGLDQGTSDFILSSAEYIPDQGLNHAQCFVGYDDAITEGSDVGAFRVVNSWGSSWMDGGYYWLTYDAFAEFADDYGQVIMIISDRIDYNPDLIATWAFSDAPTRMNDIITLGIGSHSSPLNSTTPLYEIDMNNAFPDFMALDISAFLPYYNLNNDEFFFLEIGSSISTGTISSFLIERYTAGVLVETTHESIDVPKSIPGYVRNTFMDFNHEIKVNLQIPKNPEITETYLINATVSNIGINDESNVDLFLYLDGALINSASYSTLSSGTSETIDYLWTPTVYSTFNFTVFAPPVIGEFSDTNNYITSLITVKYFINYTMTVGYNYTWIDASGGTELFLSDDGYQTIPLPFDFTFYDQTFSTIYLCSNGYLSFYDTAPWQYNNVPFPSGEPSFYYMIAPFWDDLYPPYGGHIYVQDFGDHWVAEWKDIYHIDSSLVGSFEVVLYDTGDIIFNYDYIDYTAGGYTCGLNYGMNTLYHTSYNGLTDLTDDFSLLFNREKFEHDLEVTLDIPSASELNTSYNAKATVKNNGVNDESNINFYLYYDDNLVNETFISTLLIGESAILTYNWTPNFYRTYKFSASTPPVPNEIYLPNNHAEQLITIHPVKLFDGMYLNYTFNLMGAPYKSDFYYSSVSDTIFHSDHLISQAGNPIQTGYWDVDSLSRLMANSYGGLSFGSGTHTPLWIFTDNSIGDLIPIAVDGEGDHIFNTTGEFIYDLPGFGTIDAWILEDLASTGGVALYEKSTGILLYGNFPYTYGTYTFELVNTNALFEYIVFDHDLHVSLETPTSNRIGETYVINATVKNRGINDEYNVDLFLYLEEVEVASITIPTLSVGMEQTIQYSWNPTHYGNYNFTAYAPYVPSESYLENNFQTKIVSLFETELFNGLYIKHTYSQDTYTYNTNFTYSLLGGSIYYESLGLEYMGMHMTYTWQVDALTRVMSGGSGFGDGAHTLAWIFTNTSLYDLIPIAVDGEGDHSFNVTRDLYYNLPGFGPIEVWELKDLTQPGGIAWYEKSTGILLNGTFYYAGGSYSYEFNFIDTNAELRIADDIPPGSFILSSNAQDPDEDGTFNLIWSNSLNADNYSVYSYSSFITSINGSLTLLADEIENLNLAQTGYTDGTYFFIVVAHNDYGNTLSNCIEITVTIAFPPGDFILSSTATNPDTDGNFDLVWTESQYGITYSIYRELDFITEINQNLTLIAYGITDLSLALTGYPNGDYYFIVVAHNNQGDTLSNCIQVTVQKQSIIIPGYDLWLIIGLLGIVSFCLFKKRFNIKA